MKISALISVATASQVISSQENFMNTFKAGRYARSKTLFDEIFADNNERTEVGNRFAFSETDSLFQVLQFYLQVHGKDFFLADKIVSYGCWCQVRNQAEQGIVPGKIDNS